MKKRLSTSDESDLRRLREASEWVLRMDDGRRTDAEIEEWLRWCFADPENFSAFEKVQGDWRDLDALRELPAEPVTPLGASEDPVEPEAQKPDSRRYEPQGWLWQMSPDGRRVFGRSTAAIALVACAGALGVAMLWMHGRHRPHPAATELVATDMNRAQTLPDGSRIILRTESSLNIDFRSTQRDIRLLSGEAYFNVVHNKRQPFVVSAGPLRVTDLGTQFDIRRARNHVTVTVEEGIVRVSAEEAASAGLPSEWSVEAGYQLTYFSQRRAEMISRADVASALQWRDGELAYVEEPLRSVISDLDRYAAHKILIEDPAVADMRFTGTAFPNALDDWLKAIVQAYPVTVRTEPNGDLILSARKDQSSSGQ